MGRFGLIGAGVVCASAFGQVATFAPLWTNVPRFAVVGAEWRTFSQYAVLSGDGGTATDGIWRWTRVGGVIPAGFVPGFNQSSEVIRRPADLSFDGRSEVGVLAFSTDRSPAAVYWETQARFDILPVNVNVTLIVSQAISGDGNWIVFSDPGNVNPRKRYRRSSSGNMETFPNAFGRQGGPVFSPSADGSASLADDGIFRVDPGLTAEDAEFLAAPTDFQTSKLSSDGRIAVGAVVPNSNIGVVWHVESGTLDRFAPPLGFRAFSPWFLSDDGKLVIGNASLAGPGARVFVRRAGEQARELRVVLDRFGDPSSNYFVLERAGGLSRDGKTMMVMYSSPWYGDGAAIVTLPDWEPCPSDLNFDGFVDDADFSIFAKAYDRLTTTDGDLNVDQFTDDADFSVFAVAYDILVCP